MKREQQKKRGHAGASACAKKKREDEREPKIEEERAGKEGQEREPQDKTKAVKRRVRPEVCPHHHALSRSTTQKEKASLSLALIAGCKLPPDSSERTLGHPLSLGAKLTTIVDGRMSATADLCVGAVRRFRLSGCVQGAHRGLSCSICCGGPSVARFGLGNGPHQRLNLVGGSWLICVAVAVAERLFSVWRVGSAS